MTNVVVVLNYTVLIVLSDWFEYNLTHNVFHPLISNHSWMSAVVGIAKYFAYRNYGVKC